MLIVQGQNIERRFGSDVLFSHLNFQIADQARIGLVGPNGAGKSTLLKIINQEHEPDAGTMIYQNQLSIGYLAQNPTFQSGNTIYEEMERIFDKVIQDEQRLHQLEQQMAQPGATSDSTSYQKLLQQYDQLQIKFKDENGYGFRSEIRSVLAGFGFPEKRFADQALNLSGGEQSRLAFAKMLLEQHDLLILDEPTNHLDIDTLNWLEKYLQGYRGALLIVSHDQYFLDHTIKEVYALEHGSLRHYTGNYSRYLKERATNLELAWKAYNKQQDEIKKMEDFVQKNIVRASTTKRAQSRRKQLEKLQRLPRPQGNENNVHFQFTIQKNSGNDVLKVQDLKTGYPDKTLDQKISFTLTKGERLGVIGPNGVGKSTLIKTLIDQLKPLAGTVDWGTNVQIGYYDQTLNQLDSSKDVLHEIWDANPTMDEKDIRNILGSFLFQDDSVFSIVHDLSGGEKARLTLCKLALEHNNLLIMDEPTNHLDIQSKEILEEALKQFAGTVLFVSHDRYLLNEISTKILELQTTTSEIYLGNYDYYLAKKAETNALKAEQTPSSETDLPQTNQGQQNYQEAKKQQSAQRKKERKLAALEQQIDEFDQQIASINQEMLAPENLSSYSKLQELQEQLDSLQQQKKQVEEQWEDLID
ncbi:ABC-F family ATP-binding cassette domain-containing protein [Bombilactobacillus folatiphilus]|uniref:ABC-F family ATP-binding cassette domain-containing protein n=1 Tax=Bombilactobacillus folatiphilus TaxID=2923362 RepID=A0ABY4PA12_9LACO|nr:ABC-F family ATP-binding cassette domain-containing protein [Bombilactobacillus folatiphilus]UQS82440.1 ABC-F family ATP-binding cassette domain-containing protein [Bombilactobacillus folatiphilus]